MKDNERECKECRVCGTTLPEKPFLVLDRMPALAQNLPGPDNLAADAGIDIRMFQCRDCGLVQLDCPPVGYYRDVIRAGGGTTTMRALRREQYRDFITKCGLEGKRILEVGCGQGEFLEMLEGFPVRGYGIENNPDLVVRAREKGLNVTCDFAEGSGHRIPGGPFDAFMQFNFIEHQPDPNGMVRCIRENLVPRGCGLVTAPCFEYIRKDCVYEVMRDHLSYFSERSLRLLFERNGFDVLESGFVNANRDTVYVMVRLQEMMTQETFRSNLQDVRADLNAFVAERTSDGRRLAFWAASHQCFTASALLEHPERVRYIVDSAVFKQGRFSPVSHIPIVPPETFFADPPETVLVTAPGYTDEIADLIRGRLGRKISLYALRSDRVEELDNGLA